jgi:hypothetical protein
MFTGIQYYGSGYHREIGERPEDVARAQEYQRQRQHQSDPFANEYRGREIGEKPWEVPSRSQQAENYRKSQYETPSYPTTNRYETRPREMGETPEDVARAEQNRPKRYDEMTEQERRLDLFA